jgi:hypothetical protein
VAIRKSIARLRRELENFEIMMASIEESMAASRERQRAVALPKTTRDLIARLHPPFPEPDFGLWLREDRQ